MLVFVLFVTYSILNFCKIMKMLLVTDQEKPNDDSSYLRYAPEILT